MKTPFLRNLWLTTAVVLATPSWVPSSAHAQTGTDASLAAKKQTFALELDPLAYILQGYGLLAAYQPHGYVRLTAGGFKVGKLPDFITNDGDNENFSQSLYGFALWVNVFPDPVKRNWGFGALFERRYHTYSNSTVPGVSTKQTRTDLIPAVSYRWRPWDNYGFYVLPWFGVAIPLGGRDDVFVGQIKYQPRAVDYFITAHIGWEI
jgi:hypothetical protein